jgi:hypothetical protein
METVRINICYRPLRIAWAVHSSEREAFREAVRLTHALWGGQFNPIVLVDRKREAEQVIDLFRPDLIVPVGKSADTWKFPKHFPHLIVLPHLSSTLLGAFPAKFFDSRGFARILDMVNAATYWKDTAKWEAITNKVSGDFCGRMMMHWLIPFL